MDDHRPVVENLEPKRRAISTEKNASTIKVQNTTMSFQYITVENIKPVNNYTVSTKKGWRATTFLSLMKISQPL